MVRFPTVCADRSMNVTLKGTRAIALKMIVMYLCNFVFYQSKGAAIIHNAFGFPNDS